MPFFSINFSVDFCTHKSANTNNSFSIYNMDNYSYLKVLQPIGQTLMLIYHLHTSCSIWKQWYSLKNSIVNRRKPMFTVNHLDIIHSYFFFQPQYYIFIYIYYLPFPGHFYLAYTGKLFPSVVCLESNGSHIRIWTHFVFCYGHVSHNILLFLFLVEVWKKLLICNSNKSKHWQVISLY